VLEFRKGQQLYLSTKHPDRLWGPASFLLSKLKRLGPEAHHWCSCVQRLKTWPYSCTGTTSRFPSQLHC